MKKYAHNFNEVKALVKESIDNGTIFDLDDTEWLTHDTGLHIADIYINKNQFVVARTYNHSKDSINYTTIGSIEL